MSVEPLKAHPYKNKSLWAIAIALLVASLVANYTYPTIPWLLRLGAWVIIIVAFLTLIWFTDQGQQSWTFSKLARNELRKVVWPTRGETTQATIFVGVMVVILALLLWGIDAFWAWLITLITV